MARWPRNRKPAGRRPSRRAHHPVPVVSPPSVWERRDFASRRSHSPVELLGALLRAAAPAERVDHACCEPELIEANPVASVVAVVTLQSNACILGECDVHSTARLHAVHKPAVAASRVWHDDVCFAVAGRVLRARALVALPCSIGPLYSEIDSPTTSL